MRMKILAASAVAAAFLATSAIAHPHPEGGEKIERVIVMTHDGDHKKGGARAFRMHRGGEGMAFTDCGGDKTEIEEGVGKEKTRIFICGKPGLSGEERAKKLEEVRARLAQNDHFSSEHRAKVESALQEAIKRARSGK